MIGKNIANILPITCLEDEAIQIAKQTNQLHKIPLVNASKNVKLTFMYAVFNDKTPSASCELCEQPDKYTKYARRIEPTKFPAYTIDQFLNNFQMLVFLSITANVIITLPVNSSAPVRTTIIKPVANVIAPTSFAIPQLSCSVPVITVNET